MVGERTKNGFMKSMGDAIGNEARETGTDYSKQQIKGYLDI